MEMESQSYYWVLVIILIVALIWTKTKNKNLTPIIDTKEGFASDQRDEPDRQKLSQLLGSLLDNQTIANQILIDYKISSISDLIQKNKDRLNLKLKPILRSHQYQTLLRYLLLKDVYFIGSDSKDIIKFARNEEIVHPSKLYNESSQRTSQLLKFRKQYHLNKDLYLEYTWITDKIQTYITQYGFRKVTKSFANLKEIFRPYWEGKRELSKKDLESLPSWTTLYFEPTNTLYLKLGSKKWYSWMHNENDKDLIFRTVSGKVNKWKELLQKTPTVERPPIGSYMWIRGPSSMSLEQLYRKVDELSREGYFKLAPYYDSTIKLPGNLHKVSKEVQRLKLLKKWIDSNGKDLKQKKLILENILIDLNHRVIRIFDDLAAYLVFFQYQNISHLHLENNPKEILLGGWWLTSNLDDLLVKATELGQCYLPAKLSVRKVQDSPPIYKYTFNNNIYHIFWEPIEIYINQLEHTLENIFKTDDVSRVAPVARFCLFNNPSLREYIKKYIACTKTKCPTNISDLKEPERCGELKLKYQELLSLKQKYHCLFKSKTDANPKTDSKSNKLDLKENFQSVDLKQSNAQSQSEEKINQMMGFGKVVLLDVVEYAIKLHQCQTQNIKMKDCQDLEPHIETDDQPGDQDLAKVEINRQSDLYNIYDQQMDQYHKILHNQEVKKLKPLNFLANQNHKDEQKKVNLLRDAADDFHGIFNDLTQLPSQIAEDDLEDFDNQLEDNLDLSPSSFDKYKTRLERQMKGYHQKEISGVLEKTKKIGFQVWDIMTKDGRTMTSGFVLLVLAFALYFIDISS